MRGETTCWPAGKKLDWTASSSRQLGYAVFPLPPIAEIQEHRNVAAGAPVLDTPKLWRPTMVVTCCSVTVGPGQHTFVISHALKHASNMWKTMCSCTLSGVTITYIASRSHNQRYALPRWMFLFLDCGKSLPFTDQEYAGRWFSRDFYCHLITTNHKLRGWYTNERAGLIGPRFLLYINTIIINSTASEYQLILLPYDNNNW